MTSAATIDGPARKARKAVHGVVLVSGPRLAAHLAMTRQSLEELASRGVIERRPDGRFDQDACRVAYLKHLRSENRRSPRSEADTAHLAAKTEFLKLRLLEKRRELVPRDEFDAMIDGMAGLVLTKLNGLPARIAGHDLAARRRAEAVVIELRRELSEAASRLADAAGEAAPAER